MGRDSRFPHMCRALLRFPHQSFMPLEPYPARYARHLPYAGKALSVVILFPHMRVFALTLWGKQFSRIVAFPIGKGGPGQRRSDAFVNCLLEAISLALFHPAFPIQPPPLRGTTFHRKEGVSTRAPSLGRGCRAQRGGVGFLFLRRSRLLFAFPTFLIPHSGRAFIPDQGAAHPTGES